MHYKKDTISFIVRDIEDQLVFIRLVKISLKYFVRT